MLRACHCCGLIQRLPALEPGQVAVCSRCGVQVQREAASGNERCAAADLVALILFVPAVLLPLLEVERLGHRHQASLLWGTIELLREGSWFVGTVVLVFSLIFPLVKILLLLELSLVQLLPQRHKALTYRIMAVLGKWSMLDVLLLALLVMLVKLGNLVSFRIGPAALAFVLCVAASLVASLLFDPQAIWQEDRGGPGERDGTSNSA